MPWTCVLCQTELGDDTEKCECGMYRPHRPRPGAAQVNTDIPRPEKAVKPKVARSCPSCGCDRYQKARPRGVVAFIKDRICAECQTRYTPPTPIWAAWVFVAAGSLLAGTMALAILLRAADPSPWMILGMIVEVPLGIMGLLAVAYGA